jgi:WD40 repeat protein/tRNA A-37 threonylcarbamoyl transferase component Bud32
MTDIKVDHPPGDRLAAYAQGRCDEPEMDEIEQHLCTCNSCCRLIRDQPDDSLVARLRARSVATVAPPATGGEAATEPLPGFQVPSSFVVGPATNPALHDQPTITGPSPDLPGLAGIPKELHDHPRYRVVAALGAGGMGTVYRAEHRLMDRPVALKVIRNDLLSNQALVERFRREVKAAACLASHPNVVAAYDAEQAGETHMLVMEFIEGSDLARLVDRCGPLPVGEACEYARQAALGLQHAFEGGMVHRDIKPQNLMRTTRGQVKILDFGLARFVSEVGSHAEGTAEGMVLGSADYIAPEQINGPHAADIRADIYSLGCTLYFLLAGHPPFSEGNLIQKLMAHREKTARPLSEIRADVPPELARTVERMMDKDPARRFQAPDEMARVLAPFADARAAATSLDAPATAGARILAETPPWLASTVGAPEPSKQATRPGPRPWRPWVRIAAALAILPIVAGLLALITYRIQTQTGELVIESDDPSIEVVVKQGGQKVTIVDPKTKDRIELKAGRYELQLAGGAGLKLSTDSFTLKRGDKTVVTVRRAAPTPVSRPLGPEPLLVEIALFRGHTEPIDGLAVSLDGRRLLSGSNDDSLILWDRETAQPIRRFEGHPGDVMAVAISPDGRRALSGGENKIIQLWDLESGETIREFRGHTERIFSVAFSPDGRRAYSTSGGINQGGWRDGTDSAIRVWDVETGQEVRRLEGHKGIVWSVVVSPDGRRLLSAGNDTQVILWDARTGAEIRRFREHPLAVRCAAFFPDGRRAVSCGNDRTIRLWDVETGQEIRRFPGHAHSIGSVAVSPNGRWLVSSDHEGHELWLWDVETGQTVQRINWGNVIPIRGSFTPDGRHAVWTGSDAVIRMYRLSAPGQDEADHAEPPPRWPTGEQPALVEVSPFRGHDAWVLCAVVSPDGRRILSGSGEMILWDRETTQPIRRFKGHNDRTMTLAISPDGRRALSGGSDKVVRLWDLESGDLSREFHGHTEWVFSVAFSPDGRLAYSTSGGFDDGAWRDGTDSAIRVWDVETGQEVRKLEGHKGIVWRVALSPDGRHVLSGGSDKASILWDAKTGAEIRRFRGHTARVDWVDFLPDGRRAVSCGDDRTIRLWDVESGREIHCFRGHQVEVVCVAISPDGRWLLSADHTGHDLRLWDVEARKQVQRIDWWGQNPTRGSFTPDGRYAVWPGNDGVVRMYRLTEPARADHPTASTPPSPAGRDHSVPLAKVAPKPSPSLVKSRRWDWIHDASLPEFYGWIKRMRASGYRPVFVNGHNPAPAEVRIAAIAVKDELNLPFEILHESERDHHSRYAEVKKRGYQLSGLTTFDDGAAARVLSIYTRRDRKTGAWYIPAAWLPEPFIGERTHEGVRPFSIATRPQGDSWRATVGTIETEGIAWRFHKELDHEDLTRELIEARQGGFRPESLFVCPGKEGPRFGVVLTCEDPDLLWKVRGELTSAELDSETARMAALGYSPDQVVGYASDGASRYLACWTRDRDPDTATGVRSSRESHQPSPR